MTMILSSLLYILLYNNLNVYCLDSLLYGSVSPQQQYVQTIDTVFHINVIICMSVLWKWYRVCFKCRCLLSTGSDSPHWQEASHRCYLFLYSTVVLCYTGAIRPVFIIHSIYLKYIPDQIHTCIHCNFDMTYEQSDDGFPLINVFHLDTGITSLGYNLFYHL